MNRHHCLTLLLVTGLILFMSRYSLAIENGKWISTEGPNYLYRVVGSPYPTT